MEGLRIVVESSGGGVAGSQNWRVVEMGRAGLLGRGIESRVVEWERGAEVLGGWESF